MLKWLQSLPMPILMLVAAAMLATVILLTRFLMPVILFALICVICWVIASIIKEL